MKVRIWELSYFLLFLVALPERSVSITGFFNMLLGIPEDGPRHNAIQPPPNSLRISASGNLLSDLLMPLRVGLESLFNIRPSNNNFVPNRRPPQQFRRPPPMFNNGRPMFNNNFRPNNQFQVIQQDNRNRPPPVFVRQPPPKAPIQPFPIQQGRNRPQVLDINHIQQRPVEIQPPSQHLQQSPPQKQVPTPIQNLRVQEPPSLVNLGGLFAPPTFDLGPVTPSPDLQVFNSVKPGILDNTLFRGDVKGQK